MKPFFIKISTFGLGRTILEDKFEYYDEALEVYPNWKTQDIFPLKRKINYIDDRYPKKFVVEFANTKRLKCNSKYAKNCVWKYPHQEKPRLKLFFASFLGIMCISELLFVKEYDMSIFV